MFGEQMLAEPGRFNESQSGLMNYGWRFVTLYRRQELRPSPRKTNATRQNGCLRGCYKQLRKEEKLKAKEKKKDIRI